MEKEIITQKKLIVLANDAYFNAQRHGFYPDNTDITTALMLIITEMAEAVQADTTDTEVSKTMRARFRWAEIFLLPTRTLLKER